MQKVEFVFPMGQRTQGSFLVCPCCNEVIAGGAVHVTRAAQEVHEACARRFDLVMQMKPEIEQVLGAVPQQVLEGTDLSDRLTRAFTITAIRNIVTDFCKAMQKAKGWLKEQFSELAHKVAEALTPIGCRVQINQQQIMKLLAA